MIFTFISKLLIFAMMCILTMISVYYMFIIYADWDEYEDSMILMYIKIVGVFLITIAIQVFLGRYLLS